MLRTDGDLRRRFAEEIAILSEIRAVQSTVPRWLRVADSLGWETVPPDEGGDAPDDGDAAFEARVLQRIKGECIGPANAAPGRFRWWPAATSHPTDPATATLAAHQLAVLFSAGNPSRTGATPDWRPLSTRA